jgi:hypothetical protein
MPHEIIEMRSYEFLLQVYGSESENPTLLDTTSFLYDLNLAYELARLKTDEAYAGFVLSANALRRNGRPLKPDARLRVVRLRQESPIELVTAVAVVGGALTALWVVLQIAEKVYNLPMNRRKLRAEVEKLERENRAAARTEWEEIERANDRRAESALYDSDASSYFDGIRQRLSQAPITITKIEIEVVEQRETNNGR